MKDASERFRCDICGRYIAFIDFENNNASRKLITPDSEYSTEEYETVCTQHNEIT